MQMLQREDNLNLCYSQKMKYNEIKKAKSGKISKIR